MQIYFTYRILILIRCAFKQPLLLEQILGIHINLLLRGSKVWFVWYIFGLMVIFPLFVRSVQNRWLYSWCGFNWTWFQKISWIITGWIFGNQSFFWHGSYPVLFGIDCLGRRDEHFKMSLLFSRWKNTDSIPLLNIFL